MKKTFLLFIVLLFILSGCSKKEMNDEVEHLSNMATESKEVFTISLNDETPRMDDDGYWMFAILINNHSNSRVVIDMSSQLHLYYKINDDWFETENYNASYKNVWRIPPIEGDDYPWLIMLRPAARNDNITFKVIIVGEYENEKFSQVAGMVEFVIRDGQLVKINSFE